VLKFKSGHEIVSYGHFLYQLISV